MDEVASGLLVYRVICVVKRLQEVENIGYIVLMDVVRIICVARVYAIDGVSPKLIFVVEFVGVDCLHNLQDIIVQGNYEFMVNVGGYLMALSVTGLYVDSLWFRECVLEKCIELHAVVYERE